MQISWKMNLYVEMSVDFLYKSMVVALFSNLNFFLAINMIEFNLVNSFIIYSCVFLNGFTVTILEQIID